MKNKEDESSAYENFIEAIEYNKIVWNDTKINARLYDYKPGMKIKAPSDEDFFTDDVKHLSTELYNKKKIFVFNQDILVCANKLVNKNFNPLVLIMSRPTSNSGGLEAGIMRQEESIFRRTNCCCAINESLYPINHDEYIYLPEITVFKDDKYETILEPLTLSFIMCPAVRQPDLIYIGNSQKATYRNNGDKIIMREKIFGLFKIAYERGFNCLLLSALGCGSCLNPIDIIVEIFNEAINKYPIKYVIFSINGISDPMIPKKDKNFEYFNKHIKRFN